MEMRLCDDDGMVSETSIHDTCLDYLLQINNLRRHGGYPPVTEPFACTGHAHLAGEHIRCTSPAHNQHPEITWQATLGASGVVAVKPGWRLVVEPSPEHF